MKMADCIAMSMARLPGESLAAVALPNTVERVYRIQASPDVIVRFEKFLAHLQWCSGVGHSTMVAMSIDGDGADRFRVNSPNLPEWHGDDYQDRERRVELPEER